MLTPLAAGKKLDFLHSYEGSGVLWPFMVKKDNDAIEGDRIKYRAAN
jgi:hypothetical protein